jgi:hypothetical protein
LLQEEKILVGNQIKLNLPFILSAETFFKLMKFLTKKFLILLLPLQAAHDMLSPETHTKRTGDPARLLAYYLASLAMGTNELNSACTVRKKKYCELGD